MRCLWVDDLCDQINAVMTAQQQADLDASCTTDGGSPAVGTCPTTGAVAGHCLYTGEVVTLWTGVAIPGATLIDFHYSAAGWTSGIAEIWCGSYPEGTWVP